MCFGENQPSSEPVASANEPIVVYESSDDETNSEAVITAVSGVLGVDASELEPLYDVVNPDALNSLFRSDARGVPPDARGHVSFDYGSYRVRLERDGIVRVY